MLKCTILNDNVRLTAPSPSSPPKQMQMQYGSIGWSVGAVLGMSSALKRVAIDMVTCGVVALTYVLIGWIYRRYFQHAIVFASSNQTYLLRLH